MAAVDGTSIQVPTDLEGASTYIRSMAETMIGQLQTLWSQLEPLQSTWTGQAQQYYQGLQDEWNTAANGLFAPDGVLGQVGAAVGTSWTNYADAETSNAGTWRH